jgi:hypothetical protein
MEALTLWTIINHPSQGSEDSSLATVGWANYSIASLMEIKMGVFMGLEIFYG